MRMQGNSSRKKHSDPETLQSNEKTEEGLPLGSVSGAPGAGKGLTVTVSRWAGRAGRAQRPCLRGSQGSPSSQVRPAGLKGLGGGAGELGGRKALRGDQGSLHSTLSPGFCEAGTHTGELPTGAWTPHSWRWRETARGRLTPPTRTRQVSWAGSLVCGSGWLGGQPSPASPVLAAQVCPPALGSSG